MSDPSSLASIIQSLLAAFESGCEVFQRLVARPRSGKLRRRDLLRLGEDERLLGESFAKRPHQIRADYDTYATRHGTRFRNGDEQAKTSLAHILLRLNAGLAKIIDAFLMRSSKHHHLARKSLLHLSESSSTQTLHALGQFHNRLGKSKSSLVSVASRSDRGPGSRSQSSSALSETSQGSTRKQFVRSKSDSAIKVERAPINPPKTRPIHTKKRKHSGSSTRSSHANTVRTGHSRSTEDFPALADVYPRLALTPSPNTYGHRSARARPISAFTQRSDSTKIGEIPEDSWMAARLGNYQAEVDASNNALQWWPPAPPVKENRRGLGNRLKFWR